MSTSGDRHLRPEPSGKLKGLVPGPRTVLVRADPAYARTFAGQVLLQLLVNLLCRQFRVIDEVWLDVPPVPMDDRAFPFPRLQCPDLAQLLLALAGAVSGDEIRVAMGKPSNTPVVTILVGPSIAPRSESTFTIVVVGDGWNAFCSPVELSPGVRSSSVIPFGSLLAACHAAAAVFRYLHQIPSMATQNLSLWTFEAGGWQGDGSPSAASIRLPPAYLIGLGAVGAAFVLSLALTPGLCGSLIGIDPQLTDETGRNRLLSMFHQEVGQWKVALAATLLEGTAIDFFPNHTQWPEYVTEPDRDAPPEMRAEEEAFRYLWVISCVDRNIHRQNIAGYLPRHVLSGSTDGLVAQATYYAMEGDCECLACNHPVPPFDLDTFVEELRGLPPPDRLARYESWCLQPAMRAAIDEYLFNPECGQAAEAELRRLGVDGTTDWSVGFVSASAGIMLAALFVRCALDGVDKTVGEIPERRLIFLGDQKIVGSRARRKPDCSVCGSTDRRKRFNRRWNRLET